MDLFIEELIESIGNSYDVVVTAAKRAKQLCDGARPLVEIESKNTLTIALHEIAAGKIIVLPPEEAPEQTAEMAVAGEYLDRRGDIDEFVEKDNDEQDEEDDEEED